jgi:galactose oxidase
VLMGLGSMTHAFDMNQRYVQLAATPQGATAAQVTGPADIQTAPPGHYMLFVLNESRVPSIARFVRVAP